MLDGRCRQWIGAVTIAFAPAHAAYWLASARHPRPAVPATARLNAQRAPAPRPRPATARLHAQRCRETAGSDEH